MEELSPDTSTELKQLFDSLTKTAGGRSNERPQNAGDSDDLTQQFSTLQSRLENILTKIKTESDLFYKVLVMKNSLTYEEAKIRLAAEDISGSQEFLEKTLACIHEYRNHPRVMFLYLRIVNHLAYLLSKKGELEKAQELLEEVTKSEVGSDALVYRYEKNDFNYILTVASDVFQHGRAVFKQTNRPEPSGKQVGETQS